MDEAVKLSAQQGGARLRPTRREAEAFKIEGDEQRRFFDQPRAAR